MCKIQLCFGSLIILCFCLQQLIPNPSGLNTSQNQCIADLLLIHAFSEDYIIICCVCYLDKCLCGTVAHGSILYARKRSDAGNVSVWQMTEKQHRTLYPTMHCTKPDLYFQCDKWSGRNVSCDLFFDSVCLDCRDLRRLHSVYTKQSTH